MKTSRRVRISILAAMGIVALAAVLLGWVAAERRKRVATFTAELHRREERASWAERMRRLGYVSKASVAAEHKNLTEVRSRLKWLGAPPVEPPPTGGLP